jgi:ABC-type multidrug transport system permease subunit
MQILRATIGKELRLRSRDKTSLVLWIGIPLLIGGSMSLVFGRDGGTPQGRLLIADQDGQFLSRLISGGFSGGPMAEMFDPEEVERGEGRALMDAGEATAMIVIPDGFSDALLRDEPTTITLVVNPSQTILPGIVEEMLSILGDAAFYLQRIAGDEMRLIAEGPPEGKNIYSEATALELTRGIRGKLENLDRYFDPLLIQLETEIESVEIGSRTNFGALFFPGILFMSLLFISQGLSGEYWKEHEAGTLSRTAVAPPGLVQTVAAKTLVAAAVIAAAALAALALGSRLLGVVVEAPITAFAWTIAVGTLFYLLMSLIQLFATGKRNGDLLTNMLLFPLLMAGGSFFPSEAMPGSIAAFGEFTPNGWALARLKEILAGTIDATSLATAFGIVALASAVLFLLNVTRLRRAFVGG